MFGRTKENLAGMVNAPKSFYRTFEIPKRKGGKRKILAPYPSLCGCQRWILDNILYKAKISRSCHGFVKKKSIISNANNHLNKNFIIKLDLKDFFPSIGFSRVFGVFRSFGYNDNVCFYFARLCTCDGGLIQGSPASPFLSNIIGYNMDRRLIGYLRRRGAKYTRYADDITISADSIKSIKLYSIYKIIEEEGFFVNHEKTVISKEGQRKIVTGIDISNGKLRPTKKFRRELSQEVHYISKFGLNSHMNKRKIKNPFYISTIHGKLAFWEMIEPSSNQLKRLKLQIGLPTK